MIDPTLLAQQSTNNGGGICAVIGALIYIAVIVVAIVGMWKMFVKAGKPGWAAIIPIYNIMVLAEIGGKPNWWGLLCLIPFVNIVILIMILAGVSTNFGKGVGFTLGLIFLGPIFFAILGFGDSVYHGSGGPQAAGFPVMPNNPRQ